MKVMLADDHPLLLRGLGDLIAGEPDFEIVGTAPDGATALSLIRDRQPDIAVLDLAMPAMSGLAIAEEVAAHVLPVRIVLLTALISDEQVVQAVAAGIWGILLKEAALDNLCDALHAVAGGHRWLPDELVQQAFSRQAESDRRSHAVHETLTSREREIVTLVCDGNANADIAVRLGLSPGTVRIHLHNIYMKLDVKNRTALAALALKGGLAPPLSGSVRQSSSNWFL